MMDRSMRVTLMVGGIGLPIATILIFSLHWLEGDLSSHWRYFLMWFFGGLCTLFIRELAYQMRPAPGGDGKE